MERVYYRRASGLKYRWVPCRPQQAVRVLVPRPGALQTYEVARAQMRLLTQLSRWRTAEEVGATPEALQTLEAANLLYHAHGEPRPEQQLAGRLPLPGAQRLWLAENAWVTPVVHLRGQVGPFPFMPRRGELRRAALWGAHVALMQPEGQTSAVGVSCCTHHGKLLRALLWRLTAGLEGEVPQELAPLLQLLADAGVLSSDAPTHLPAAVGPRATWLGHACVLVELAGARILVDPLFQPLPLPMPTVPGPPDPRRLGRIDAVLITHGDNDHFNPQALLRLDPATPVFIPMARRHHPWHVDMARLLRLLHFENVTAVEPWQKVTVGGATVIAAPFVGEDWGLPLPQLTWLMQGGGRSVYCNADAALMPQVYRAVAQHGPVDMAFLGVGGCEEAMVMPPGFGYGNFYQRWVSPAQHNRWVQHCSNPQDAAQAAVLLGARKVFGYAAGGAPFIPVAYSDRGTHEQLAALLAGNADGPQPASLVLGQPFAL